MAVHIGSGVSTSPDTRVAAIEASTRARDGLGGGPADLAFVFASGAHLAAPEATLEATHEGLLPRQLAGCGAGGVLGGGRELESGTAVAVWAASLGDGSASVHEVGFDADQIGLARFPGMPDPAGAAALVVLPDPYAFPADALLDACAEEAPGVPVLGGLSSARTLDGSSALFVGDRVLEGGAVVVRLDAVEVLPCVSQGAAPFGPELTVTAADGHMILELAGAPALAKVREIVEELPPDERQLVAEGLLVGLVIGAGKPEYGPGDFLVRGVLGADPERGAIAVGAPVSPGQVLRLHARDAASADRDLRAALELRLSALGGTRPAGALCFTCNGRGRHMFETADHDAAMLDAALGGAAAAGFFAAGEIGPVGGRSFLHGFTATIALFAGG